MSNTERCPMHPNAEPVEVVVRLIRSHQSDYPTSAITEMRCPEQH